MQIRDQSCQRLLPISLSNPYLMYIRSGLETQSLGQLSLVPRLSSGGGNENAWFQPNITVHKFRNVCLSSRRIIMMRINLCNKAAVKIKFINFFLSKF